MKKIFMLTNWRPFIRVLPLLALGVSAWSQAPHDDPLAESLFPPELILEHSDAIGLTEEQRTSLMGELQKAEDRFGDLHQKLQKEIEAAAALLKKDQVDETAALDQLEKIL